MYIKHTTWNNITSLSVIGYRPIENLSPIRFIIFRVIIYEYFNINYLLNYYKQVFTVISQFLSFS